MAYEKIEPVGEFTLNKNDKGNNPKRPDYRGEVTIEGESFVIAGWIREVKATGKKFISGTVTPKQKKEERAPSSDFPASSEPQTTQSDDGDVPF